MDDRLNDARTSLASGDSEEVNRAINEIEALDTDERAELFDEVFEMCLELYDDGDGYQRQSVVRYVRAVVPRRRLFEVLERADSEAEVAEQLIPNGMDTSLDQIQTFYLTAMDDDDGRVRLAAIKGLKQLTIAYQMVGAESRLDDLLEQLNELLVSASGKKQEHIQRACRDVHVRQGSTLDEMIAANLDEEP